MLTSSEGNPFGAYSSPFGEGAFSKSEGPTEDIFQKGEEVSLVQEIANIRRTLEVGGAVKAVTRAASNYLAEIGKAVVTAVKTIVVQAVKMALFKFAIESCALGIKTLVEMMVGMKLTPPNIDTRGVFYNMSGVTSSGGTSSQPPPPIPPPRYDNPFASPFSASAW